MPKFRLLVDVDSVVEEAEHLEDLFKDGIEADNEEEIRVFQRNDPIFKANIWDEIIISPFNKRVDNLSIN